MRLLRIATVAGALALSTGALAQGSNVEQARTFFNAGASAYQSGLYLAAVQAFNQAYLLSPREGLIFSMAQSYRRQFLVDKKPEHLRAALAKYDEYLQKAPGGPRRGDAVEAIAELQKIAEQSEISLEGETATPDKAAMHTRLMISSRIEDAQISVDGGKLQALPLIAEVKPGKHRIRVTKEGFFDEEREVAAAEGGVVALDIPLRERPALLTFETDEGAEVMVNGRIAGVTPLLKPLELPAGRHFVAVSMNGTSGYAEELDLTRGEKRQLEAELDVTGQRVTSYVFFATGGAAVVAGAVFAGIAAYHQSQAKEIDGKLGNQVLVETADGGDLSDYNDSLERRNAWRNVAGLAFGAGVAVGATGFLLFLFDEPALKTPSGFAERDAADEKEEAPSEPSTMEVSGAPYVYPGGAGLSVVGRF